MNFESMTKEELINILKRHYVRLKAPIPDRDKFIVGNYYQAEQTGDDEVTISAEIGEDFDRKHDDIMQYIVYLSFDEADKYFEK